MGGNVSFPRLQISKDRIFVVTGANTGIGYEVAKWIAMMGGTVIMACRSETRAKEAIQRMNEEYIELKKEGKEGLVDMKELSLQYMHLDLASLQSTKDFVETFKRSYSCLHVLVCNAGLTKANYEKTDDGYEVLFQVMQMYCLQRRLKNTNVSITSLHPGHVDTRLIKDFDDSWQMYLANRFGRLIGSMRTPLEGAKTILYAVLDSKLKGVSGVHLKDCKPINTSSIARDGSKQEEMWAQTMEYLKDHFTTEEMSYLEGMDPLQN